jgi:hypothetical protein
MIAYYKGQELAKGASAYDLAVAGGYTGTEADFNRDLLAVGSVTESINSAVSNKADKATTISGYGITDAYTKTEVDSAINNHKITVDSALSNTSENPVQNKVIEENIDDMLQIISDIATKILDFADVTSSSISIATTAWDSTAKTATISVSGVTETNHVIISPTPDSYDAYGAASIRCTAKVKNSLTFLCKTIPTQTINIDVLILTVQGEEPLYR